ncbi:MAG: glycosyltransferase family 39 protein [candidate division WOR-3 bacterium]
MFFPPLFVYLAASLQMVGVEVLMSVRLISAFSGALIIPLLYLIFVSCYNTKTSNLVALTGIPLFSLHSYSRLGQVDILMLVFVVLTGFFLVRLMQYGKPANALWAGLAIGIGTWTKETMLGTFASSILFLLILPANRWRSIGLLLLGATGPLLLLAGLGAETGQNLLYEVTASRGYDINMLKLPLISSLFATGANLGINLYPRMFSKLEFMLFVALAPPTVILLMLLVFKGTIERRPFPLWVSSYLAIHLPFFTLFSRKFDYYLLPGAILLLSAGACETFSCKNSARANQQIHMLRISGKVIISAIILYNIIACRLLYSNPGTHGSFRAAIVDLEPGTRIATSHPTLAQYISDRASLGLRVTALFEHNSYRISWPTVTDTATKAIVLKKYYYDKLRATNPRDWDSLTRFFPIMKEYIDSTWSIWFFSKNTSQDIRWTSQRLNEFIKPIGVITLLRSL